MRGGLYVRDFLGARGQGQGMTVALPAGDSRRPLSGITSGPGPRHPKKLGKQGDRVSRVSSPPGPLNRLYSGSVGA